MILRIVWWICVFCIVEAMIGYPISLLIINKIFKKKENEKNLSYEPEVTIMVVAHNEEKVIEDKLENLLSLDYPKEKLKILIASDFSTDKTNEIVEEFIKTHSDRDIKIHKSVKHFGKTNAQNEAQELVDTEILVMTDANAIIENNAIKEIVLSFASEDIVYVCGQLKYVNSDENKTANSEGIYWKLDLMCREIESKFQTITAGNGALYACRNAEYKKIAPIKCHDSEFPLLYALDGKRAIYNKEAIAYEKAGEVEEDEFKRKVRMNRIILDAILPRLSILNVFKYRWFSYFYFGHRTCRYLLWITHVLAYVLNTMLLGQSMWWNLVWILQTLFYLVALFGWKTKSENRWIKIITYYCMTVVAQWKGVINIITGKSKPTWEKAESTR